MSTLPGKPFIRSRQIRQRIRELAGEIRTHYDGQPLVIVGLMNGCVFFLVDLLRHLPPNYQVECWRVQSYQGKASTGKLTGLEQARADVRNKNVLIVDDILDTGLTLHAVHRKLVKLGARRVEGCVLLRKHKSRRKKVTARWVGFDIADEFVVGYGLDFDGQYRGLPDIRVLNGPG